MREVRERFCPHCGRANAVTLPRCMNCGQRIGGNVLLTETEEVTQRAPWWQTSESSAIPPPPQVREQLVRQEVALREKERLAEEQRRFQERLEEERKRSAERLAAIREKRQARLDQNNAAQGTSTAQSRAALCYRCKSPLGQAGHQFSFCLNCGADVQAKASATSAATAMKNTASVSSAQTAHSVRPATMTAPISQISTHTTTRGTSDVNPGVAAILSFLFPGIGQFLNGQPTKGAILLLALFVAMVIFNVNVVLLLVGRILAALDAYRIAERRRRGAMVREDEWDFGG